ncbi:virion structural protein [Vibrio phage vB_VpaM_sm033]|nr:virion structural protein [Vibrio phage vB_VpaM_sm033]
MEFDPDKRDRDKVLSAIHEETKYHKWMAKENIKIVFPKRYINGKLGNLDERFNTVAIFAVILEDGTWEVCSICSIIPLTPSGSSIIKINGVDYYELTWEKGQVICPNLNLVQRSNLAFEIYDEFITKNRLPPYMDNLDSCKILDSLKEFSGVNLGANFALLRIYNATTTRSLEDRTVPAREQYKTQADFHRMDVDRIALRSVAYVADNTTSRLNGSYLAQGFNSALVNPSESIEEVEQVYIS